MAGNKFLTTGPNGAAAEVRGVQVSSGAASAGAIPALSAAGVFDASLMPTGIGADVATIAASEAIAAGSAVNIWANAGAFNVRNADGSTSGKEAHGFVLAAVANGALATVYFGGNNNAVSGLSPGMQFLSATAVGAATTTMPAATGQTVQRLGPATSSTSYNFSPEPPILLA